MLTVRYISRMVKQPTILRSQRFFSGSEDSGAGQGEDAKDQGPLHRGRHEPDRSKDHNSNKPDDPAIKPNIQEATQNIRLDTDPREIVGGHKQDDQMVEKGFWNQQPR
ncbi:hypothetical protein NEOLI_003409 [Neolecta irregularis DAH-3]|uniref:Uncharacterized protein n=1 Tax=Neolecta irregularis (strain DAH-3) TaxID=1198029 RepID=A0A1U7LNN5_NEOID|nr:hypothetical protein NEOLI_003409 [Neolecta irregularis DAH-3]|eukprot:OLL24276.1 hypothetical protein NEOLI_003409 [Neolecta irregularis DAH-3]